MNRMLPKLEFEELTEKIIGCAYRVYNALGSGFVESVYEGQVVGDVIADLLVNDTIIVELKSVNQLVQAHEVQLVNYLVEAGKPIGLLINFRASKVDIKRTFKDRKQKGIPSILLSCKKGFALWKRH